MEALQEIRLRICEAVCANAAPDSARNLATMQAYYDWVMGKPHAAPEEGPRAVPMLNLRK